MLDPSRELRVNAGLVVILGYLAVKRKARYFDAAATWCGRALLPRFDIGVDCLHPPCSSLSVNGKTWSFDPIEA